MSRDDADQEAKEFAGCSAKLIEPRGENVVDQIGFGWAQVCVFLLATGLSAFSDGVEVMAQNMLNPAITKEFGVGVDQRALVVVISTTGTLIGGLVSGYLGDRYGRRPLIMSSWLILAFFQFMVAFTHIFSAFVACRFAAGFGVGLAVTPSIALLSEITPDVYRLPMRAATVAFFNLGALVVALSVCIDDPSLENSHWRLILVGAGAFPAVAFLVVWLSSSSLILESPAFLESVGRRAEAEEVISHLAALNGRSMSKAPLALSCSGGATTAAELSVREQMSIIFSPRYVLMTLAAMYTAAALGFTQIGSEYAMPIILKESGSMPPAEQICMMKCFSVVFTGVALAIVVSMRYTRSLALSMFISCVLMVSLAFAGSCPPPRPRWLEAVFRSTNLLPLPYTMGHLVLLQLAVQLYPTTSSMTGAALVMGCFRLAGLCAPIAFEESRGLAAANDDETWTLFFYCSGAMLGVGSVLMICVSLIDVSDNKAAQLLLPGKLAPTGVVAGYGTTASRS